jgi:hypothetical protein
MPSDYKHDAFLSYLRERPCGPWVKDHFLPYFSHQLGNALNREANVFFDQVGIHAGQKWPASLMQALVYSRCLVAVWSPLYFHSEWCQNEAAIFRHRELKLGLGTILKPDGLIVGLKVNDGKHFPSYAKFTQRSDFQGYYVEGPGFFQTPLHAEMQIKIREFSEDVARIIELAPPWSPDWLTPAWTDDVIAAVPTPPAAKVAPPLLT